MGSDAAFAPLVNDLLTALRQPAAMVVRRRLLNAVLPLALYAVSASVSGYFIWHAINGDRGLKAKEAYRTEMRALAKVRDGLQDEQSRLLRRISMMGGESVDREYLEEEVRRMLGYVHKNDVLLFVRQNGQPAGE